MHDIHLVCLGKDVFGLLDGLTERKIVVVAVSVDHPMNDAELFIYHTSKTTLF
jgi:hypothetical protein